MYVIGQHYALVKLCFFQTERSLLLTILKQTRRVKNIFRHMTFMTTYGLDKQLSLELIHNILESSVKLL